MSEKLLGKIKRAEYGTVPDRPFLMGLTLDFSFESSGVGAYYVVNMSKECKWENLDRKDTIEKTCDEIYKILNDAKVNSVSQLKNIPVEVVLENNTFKSFRILTEVL